MKTFTIVASEEILNRATFIVKADSEDEAREKANDLIMDGIDDNGDDIVWNWRSGQTNVDTITENN